MKFINKLPRLDGKKIAVTGSTGGIGQALCHDLAALGADLLLLNRNQTRSEEQRTALIAQFPNASVEILTVDLEDFSSVKIITEQLKKIPLDGFILNAGAYSIPRKICKTGYDNVFQINFASPYYMVRELMPQLSERGGRVVAVGSIAHNYSKIDPNDLDFSTYRAASKVYGNAKRHLMYGLLELFRQEPSVHLSVTHPGITFTGITAHYPKLIFAIIKHPMKVIFMKPRRASLSILYGIFRHTGEGEWIGPRVFDIWGLPRVARLRGCSDAEREQIVLGAERIYASLTEESSADK